MLCARLPLSKDMHFMTKLFNSKGNYLLMSMGGRALPCTCWYMTDM